MIKNEIVKIWTINWLPYIPIIFNEFISQQKIATKNIIYSIWNHFNSKYCMCLIHVKFYTIKLIKFIV